MASKSQGFGVAKILLFLIVLIALVYTMYWLWQRQPKAHSNENQKESQIQLNSNSKEVNSTVEPKDFSLLRDKKVKIKGKLTPNVLVAIYSNSTQLIAKTASDGSFEKEININPALNQIEVITFDSELKRIDNIALNYYLVSDKENINNANNFYSGPVKTTFDNLLSISSSQGEKKVRTSRSTQIIAPFESTSEKTSTASALTDIRIGDFAIAIGNTDKEEILSATKLQIIRTDKPQNTEKFSLAKITASPKINSLTAKEGQKILDFTLDKDSKIQVGDKEGKLSDIIKDKSAAIFWHEEKDKKVVDIIFILP